LIITAFEIGLTLDAFWQLTFHEFCCASRGYAKRIETTRVMLAWTQRNLMGCWVKRPPSINRLLGKPSLLGKSKEQVAKHYKERAR